MDPTMIDGVFITHLHGDHCFGLPAVLQYVSAARAAHRPDAEPVRVYGPPGVVKLLSTSGIAARLQAPVCVWELAEGSEEARACEPIQPGSQLSVGVLAPTAPPVVPALQEPLDLDDRTRRMLASMQLGPPRERDVRQRFRANPELSWRCRVGETLVGSAQLQHRVPCWGYVFMEPPAPGAKQRKICILGDTMDSMAIAPLAYGADMVSHEATFMRGMEPKAKVSQHSTAWMAGLFARRIAAKQLVLTHFSARYDSDARAAPRHQRPAAADADDEPDEQQQRSWMSQLLQEAMSTFGSSNASAADDFFTVHVPRAVPSLPSFGQQRPAAAAAAPAMPGRVVPALSILPRFPEPAPEPRAARRGQLQGAGC